MASFFFLFLRRFLAPVHPIDPCSHCASTDSALSYLFFKIGTTFWFDRRQQWSAEEHMFRERLFTQKYLVCKKKSCSGTNSKNQNIYMHSNLIQCGCSLLICIIYCVAFRWRQILLRDKPVQKPSRTVNCKSSLKQYFELMKQRDPPKAK